MSKEIRDWATHTKTLLRQAPLSLEARCREIRERFGPGAQIDPSTLWHYYRMAKVKFRQPLRSLDTTLSEVSISSIVLLYSAGILDIIYKIGRFQKNTPNEGQIK